MMVVKTLIFTILAPGTVAVLAPWMLLSTNVRGPAMEFGAFRYLGFIPIAAGAAVYLWCAWDFIAVGGGTPAPIDAPKRLVVRGLYRYVRNPMYVGVLTAVAGEGLVFESTALFAYAACVFVVFFLFVVLYEEPVLKRKFGESYESYRRETPRWMPRFFRGRH